MVLGIHALRTSKGTSFSMSHNTTVPSNGDNGTYTNKEALYRQFVSYFYKCFLEPPALGFNENGSFYWRLNEKRLFC